MKASKSQPKKISEKSGSVRVDPAALLSAKVICAQNGFLIQDYVSDAVKEKNKKYLK